MAPRALVVEFIGLPGAGKSELSRRVATDLVDRRIAVRQPSWHLAHGIGAPERRVRKLGLVLLEILRHPLDSWRAARSIAATRQRSARTRCRLTVNWLLVVALLRRARRRQGVHLFDQGLLQAVWSLALDGDEAAALAMLRRPPPVLLPDFGIVVSASAATVEQRLHTRNGDSRLDRDPEHARDLLQRGDHLLLRIRAAIEATGPTRFLEVRNESQADLEPAIHDVASALLRAADLD